MNRTEIGVIFSSPDSLYGNEITVCGWIRNLRVMGNVGFIELCDGSCLSCLQIVFEQGFADYQTIVKQNTGAALMCTGILAKTPELRQPFELRAQNIAVIGASSPEYPLQSKRHSPEFLRTIPHLRARTNMFSAIFRVRSVAAYAVHRFFNERGFIYANTPIITASDCEGAGEMFRVTTLDIGAPTPDFSQDFFGKPVALTVSGQLEAEYMATAFSKVYTFGPTFRAENSNTPRHAAEFWMIEPEIAFADLADDMSLAEDMVKYIIKYCMEHCAAELEFFNKFIDKGLKQRLDSVVNSEFVRISYTKAVELLQQAPVEFKYPARWGCDLQTEHERYITEQIFGAPVFVTDYPAAIKAFYMRRNEDDKTVAAVDLLVPGVGEIIGGSQREERLDKLQAAMKEFGLCEQDYQSYLDTRRFGSVPHAGYGLGFERMIMYLTGVQNIRDVIPFPRTTGQI